jgi:hypothetical protein
MTEFSSTEERIAFYLKQMEKAMPEIRRQIKVYEEAVNSGKRNTKPTVVPNNI